MQTKIWRSALITSLFFSIYFSLNEFKCEEFVGLFPGWSCPENNRLGEGASGQAFVIVNGDERRVIKASNYNRGVSETEYENVQIMNHPNVIKAFEAKIDNGRYVVMTEFGQNGSLESYVNKNPEFLNDSKKVLRLFSQILSGVMHIHSKRFVHTDLKPQNIVLDGALNPKIIDFDLATPIGTKSWFHGTYPYADPALMKHWNEHDHKYTFDHYNDVYALGAILYWLTQDRTHPFEAPDREKMFNLHEKGEYKIREGTSLAITQAIHACLRRQKRDRISVDMLKSYIDQLLVDDPQKTIKQDFTLNINKRFPYILWLEQNGPLSLWAEFSEMIFVFLLAFCLIPLTVWCLKRKFEPHTEQLAAANRPLAPVEAPEAPQMAAPNEPEVVVRA